MTRNWVAKNWVAVASAEHVRIGRTRGFMQVCHGKAGPLRRIRPGDGVVYYSPTTAFGGKDGLQSFTAIGVVRDGSPYQAETEGFTPFRRDVGWCAAEEVPIKPLVGRLEFTTAKRNWGYQLRFGLFEISEHDMAMIAAAMGLAVTDVTARSFPQPERCSKYRNVPFADLPVLRRLPYLAMREKLSDRALSGTGGQCSGPRSTGGHESNTG